MDLREQLDGAIGPGPDLPLPEQRLAAGRRALRRRRVTVGAVVGVVVVVTGPAIALAGGGPAADIAPAGSASSTARPSSPPSPAPPAEEPPGEGRDDGPVAEAPISLTRGGVVVLAEGAEVIRRRQGVLDDGGRYDAYELDVDGERVRAAAAFDRAGAAVVTVVRPGDDSFDDFVAEVASTQLGVEVATEPPTGRGTP